MPGASDLRPGAPGGVLGKILQRAPASLRCRPRGQGDVDWGNIGIAASVLPTASHVVEMRRGHTCHTNSRRESDADNLDVHRLTLLTAPAQAMPRQATRPVTPSGGANQVCRTEVLAKTILVDL